MVRNRCPRLEAQWVLIVLNASPQLRRKLLPMFRWLLEKKALIEAMAMGEVHNTPQIVEYPLKEKSHESIVDEQLDSKIEEGAKEPDHLHEPGLERNLDSQ